MVQRSLAVLLRNSLALLPKHQTTFRGRPRATAATLCPASWPRSCGLACTKGTRETRERHVQQAVATATSDLIYYTRTCRIAAMFRYSSTSSHTWNKERTQGTRAAERHSHLKASESPERPKNTPTPCHLGMERLQGILLLCALRLNPRTKELPWPEPQKNPRKRTPTEPQQGLGRSMRGLLNKQRPRGPGRYSEASTWLSSAARR